IATLARADGQQLSGGRLHPERDATVVRRFPTKDGGEITAASFAGAEAVLVPTHLTVPEVRTFRAHTPVVARALQLTRGLVPSVARVGREALDRLLAYAAGGPDIRARTSTRFEITRPGRPGANA